MTIKDFDFLKWFCDRRMEAHKKESRKRIAEAQAESDARIEERYNELIQAVESKFEGESRHETALRYIKGQENQCHAAQENLTK